MKIHETTIVGIADLIATKEKFIERMRADKALIDEVNIKHVFIKISNGLDENHLFDYLEEAESLMEAALIEKLPWIIDHVYDHAIQKLEAKITANIEQLKLDLNKDFK